MPLTLREDKVWFDDVHKLSQICADVGAARENNQSVLLLSHFESTVVTVASLLREKGIGYERFSMLDCDAVCSSASGSVWLGVARAFQVGYQMSSHAQHAPVEMIVAEHHPMRSRDQELIDAAAKLACNVEVTFYFSLDDPLMTYFGVESIKALFERLGIDKSECISHHLINTAVRTAQEKIESKVGKDLPAHSAEDWFRYNLRENKEN